MNRLIELPTPLPQFARNAGASGFNATDYRRMIVRDDFVEERLRCKQASQQASTQLHFARMDLSIDFDRYCGMFRVVLSS
jgi:hypothetical protein